MSLPSKTVEISLNGYQWVARRPTRADEAEISRRWARKLAGVMGGQVESDILYSLDGIALRDEARLEVLLLPRTLASGKLDFGESAPEHWFDVLKDDKGVLISRRVSFEAVTPEEFAAVAAQLDEELKKKAGTDSPPSTE